MRKAAALVALLALNGCELIRDVQLEPKVDQANRQMAAAKVACDARFPPAVGTYLAHARCIDAAQNWTLRPLMPYPDLLTRAQTSREALAAQADRGLLDAGALGQLSQPEDVRLTLDNTTLDGPLSRSVGGATYAPVVQPISNTCAPRYGFSDCSE